MKILFTVLLTCILLGGCRENLPEGSDGLSDSNEASTPGETAGVTAVSVDEKSVGRFTFSVTILSKETGCDRYVDWWEIITEDGVLLSRRILAHSHVDEQPFTRSGEAMSLNEDATVIVRAHMHPVGYLPATMKGTISDGFYPITLPVDFAAALATSEPLPTNCAF